MVGIIGIAETLRIHDVRVCVVLLVLVRRLLALGIWRMVGAIPGHRTSCHGIDESAALAGFAQMS
jgi:hypothetical protein